MSRLTEAFDDWLMILRHCYVSTGNHEPSDIYGLPGASDKLLDSVETEVGYSLAPEIRELFGHANGVEVRGKEYNFGVGATGFRPIEENVHFLKGALQVAEIVMAEREVVGPTGMLSQPFLVFDSFWGDGSIFVECWPEFAGVVSFVHNSDCEFAWVARTLTQYLEAQVEAFNAGVILWHDEGHYFQLDRAKPGYVVGGLQVGDYPKGKDQESLAGRWRWNN